MTRRTNLTLLVAAVAGTCASGKETNPMRELLEESQNAKKGVNLYVKGQVIPGIVTKISGDLVEMRSREFSRIVVKIDAIDAAAMA
jgi:hypothetical protein